MFSWFVNNSGIISKHVTDPRFLEMLCGIIVREM